MNAIPYDRPADEWDDAYEDERTALPGRPRRQLFTRATAAAVAVVVGGAGFYAGVRVEKGELSSSSANAAGRASLLAGAGTGGAGARTGGARAGFGGGGGLARLFGGGSASGGGGGASGSFGTVSSVSGSTLYVTDTSGNTIKVTLSSVTKVTKSVGVSLHTVRPGDVVVIQGLKNSDGTMQATTVSDTGARPSALGGGAGGGSGSGSGGASPAVSSLFGSGG
jgi:hypothetical protein